MPCTDWLLVLYIISYCSTSSMVFQVFGAMWYYLATQRQMDCWEPHCKTILGYECKTIYDYVCHNNKTVNSTFLQNLCPTNNEDKKVFDFGVYLYAVQSKTTGPFNLPRRVSQSFWWALRNLRFAYIV